MLTTIFIIISFIVFASIIAYFKLEPSKRDADMAAIIYIEVFIRYFIVGYIVFAG